MRQLCILTDFTGTINVNNKLSHLWWVPGSPVFNRSSVLKAYYDCFLLTIVQTMKFYEHNIVSTKSMYVNA
jgi:hypothetical protein